MFYCDIIVSACGGWARLEQMMGVGILFFVMRKEIV